MYLCMFLTYRNKTPGKVGTTTISISSPPPPNPSPDPTDVSKSHKAHKKELSKSQPQISDPSPKPNTVTELVVPKVAGKKHEKEKEKEQEQVSQDPKAALIRGNIAKRREQRQKSRIQADLMAALHGTDENGDLLDLDKKILKPSSQKRFSFSKESRKPKKKLFIGKIQNNSVISSEKDEAEAIEMSGINTTHSPRARAILKKEYRMQSVKMMKEKEVDTSTHVAKLKAAMAVTGHPKHKGHGGQDRLKKVQLVKEVCRVNEYDDSVLQDPRLIVTENPWLHEKSPTRASCNREVLRLVLAIELLVEKRVINFIRYYNHPVVEDEELETDNMTNNQAKLAKALSNIGGSPQDRARSNSLVGNSRSSSVRDIFSSAEPEQGHSGRSLFLTCVQGTYNKDIVNEYGSLGAALAKEKKNLADTNMVAETLTKLTREMCTYSQSSIAAPVHINGQLTKSFSFIKRRFHEERKRQNKNKKIKEGQEDEKSPIAVSQEEALEQSANFPYLSYVSQTEAWCYEQLNHYINSICAQELNKKGNMNSTFREIQEVLQHLRLIELEPSQRGMSKSHLTHSFIQYNTIHIHISSQPVSSLLVTICVC